MFNYLNIYGNFTDMPDEQKIELPPDNAVPQIDPLAKNANPDPEITEFEKEEYFKSFKADLPYVQEHLLFNGQIKLVFSTLTMEQHDDIVKQIGIDRQLGTAEKNDNYFVTISKYRLGLSLVSINDVPFQADVTPEKYPFNEKTGDFYVKKRIEPFAKWQAVKLISYTDVFDIFQAKVDKLIKETTNKDFWKAVA